MRTPITTKMHNIPCHIYVREEKKRLKSIFSKIPMAKPPYPKKLRIKPPAMTEAICPETLTPMECMRRKF
jgi:hypothetical protein